MFRRRRRNRSTWFPVLGQSATVAEAPYVTTFHAYELILPALEGVGVTQVIPLVNDVTAQPGNQSTDLVSLRDQVEGSTWRCDRIVGNIWAESDFENIASPFSVLAAAAIFVAGADDENYNSVELTADEADPFNAANSANPWLWRRVWQLGNSQSFFPSTNVSGTPSIKEGSFLDTKGVKRVIGHEQRLWLALNVAQWDGQGISDFSIGIKFVWDLRVLGQMQRKKLHSTFK